MFAKSADFGSASAIGRYAEHKTNEGRQTFFPWRIVNPGGTWHTAICDSRLERLHRPQNLAIDDRFIELFPRYSPLAAFSIHR